VSDAGFGGSLRWTFGWDGSASNWARWTVRPGRAGRYRVEVWIEAGYASSESAPYAVTHDGGTTELRLDLSVADGWIALGELDFADAGEQYVTVSDATGEASALARRIPVDALRLTLLGDRGPDGGGHSGDGDVTTHPITPAGSPDNGCAAVAPSGWLLVLLLPQTRRARSRRQPSPGPRVHDGLLQRVTQ
jgi:hypothetical protein